MAFEWKLVLESVRVSLRYILAVALALSAVLFLPDSFVDRRGLLAIRQQHQPYLGAAFLLSASILFVRGLVVVTAWAREQYRERNALRLARQRLNQLTAEEKQLLRAYLEPQTKSQHLSPESGVVAGLIHADVIYQSTTVGRMTGVAHNIQPWAWDYLNAHPELLGLTVAQLESARTNPPEPKSRRALHG